MTIWHFQHYKKKALEYEMKVPDFHRSCWQVGDWTDDSDQMLLILLSLLDQGGEVLSAFLADKVYLLSARMMIVLIMTLNHSEK